MVYSSNAHVLEENARHRIAVQAGTEEPVIGLSLERQITDALRAAGLVASVLATANHRTAAWGEFVKRGLIRDWPQEQAEIAFLAFCAGAMEATSAKAVTDSFWRAHPLPESGRPMTGEELARGVIRDLTPQEIEAFFGALAEARHCASCDGHACDG